ncbi:MAG: UDP-N-acetyl-D-glucosamine 2-epimerase, UDP-hydrolysing [Candidatus Komeilibacteria bacterium RIFCSPLOWO2_01_FULL_45_10]|uniref:UDP-N-acetyl-D-glucosamine 2-epimerase, UDP-hydrolysing n=1 Tax=Candidatus Komeilibacteria bacterium RIFCSPLOWO2_01_FULL_45_10 TaxID=1798550 RepID=A0A1G2BKN3_9BACT|nr:MAG: UDP-N-acetyl-D-glucosamine 2-epimerase, UDP-hydrolysing [Candidatus Komeilibacteria bacterium RIFCSPLOWO2_01_FULL_45_10]
MNNKRRICFIITSRIHYARNKILMKLVNEDPEFKTQLIVGGSALLAKYGDILPNLQADGFRSVDKLYTSIEGGDNIAMSKTTGLAVIEFTTALQRFKPDIVVLRGDRFEVLAAAIAAAYLNKTIAHIEGGDLSGSIDESVRHAISKLSHIHFVTNEKSRDRLVKMGEQPDFVHQVGSLDIEFLAQTPPEILDEKHLNFTGVGATIDFKKPFIIVMQHPVTTGEDNFKNVNETLRAIQESGVQAFWFWPNIDAGTDDISKAIRLFREQHDQYQIRFIRHLSPEQFAALLKRAACLVGNSSAGIKEASYLGLPAVNIGTRQQNRLAGSHILNVVYDHREIAEAIKKQLAHGSYPSSDLYFKAGTSRLIFDILKKTPLYTQKKFYD